MIAPNGEGCPLMCFSLQSGHVLRMFGIWAGPNILSFKYHSFALLFTWNSYVGIKMTFQYAFPGVRVLPQMNWVQRNWINLSKWTKVLHFPFPNIWKLGQSRKIGVHIWTAGIYCKVCFSQLLFFKQSIGFSRESNRAWQFHWKGIDIIILMGLYVQVNKRMLCS